MTQAQNPTTKSPAILKILAKRQAEAKAKQAALEKRLTDKTSKKITRAIDKVTSSESTRDSVAALKGSVKIDEDKKDLSPELDFLLSPEMAELIQARKDEAANANLKVMEKMAKRKELATLEKVLAKVNKKALTKADTSLLEKLRAEVLENMGTETPEMSPVTSDDDSSIDKSQITYDRLNEEQRAAVGYGKDLTSFCLIGGAGSGKTTTQRIVLQEALLGGKISRLEDTNAHKRLLVNTPSVAIVSFTNKAVENIRNAAPAEFKSNCMTIHKLLQYAPTKVIKEVLNDKGIPEDKEIQVFEPQFHAEEKLPHLDLIIVEEGSNISDLLWEKVIAALPFPDKTAYIFLGDLNQLPPVIGSPVLADKMLDLVVVALEKVYRQKGDSPIKGLAQDVLAGSPLSDKMMEARHEPERGLAIHKFPKRISGEDLLPKLSLVMRHYIADGRYVAGRDMILTPNNNKKAINMVNMNAHIAEIYRDIENRMIYEVQAGWEKLYLAIDDIIIYQKRSWKITDITSNPDYSGQLVRQPSTNIDRWGSVIDVSIDDGALSSIENLLGGDDLFSGGDDHVMQALTSGHKDQLAKESKVNQLSHILHLEATDMEAEEDTEVAELFDSSVSYTHRKVSKIEGSEDLAFGYALTIHKSQGSEWENVYLFLHHEAMSMASRELLYTAITRAKSNLQIRYDGENNNLRDIYSSWFQKGILTQVIPGRTIADKLEYFKTIRAKGVRASALKARLKKRRISEALKDQFGE